MHFTYDIEIPANTATTDPLRETTKVCYGLLKRVYIYFPWGCAGLVGIKIFHYEHQLYPTNTGKWYTGNELFISFDCEYPITQGWNDFKVEAYNEDDFYTHTPIVGFNVLPLGMGIPLEPPWVEG